MRFRKQQEPPADGTVCRHDVRMDRSCLKCGRFVQVIDENYGARQAQFDESLRKLEEMMKPFLEEVEKAKAESEEIDRNQPPLPPEWWKRKY